VNSGILAIIDGDIICHNACPYRPDFLAKNDTAVITYDTDGHQIHPEMSTPDKRKYLEKSWHNFQVQFNELIEDVFCTDYVMAVKGEDNYRDIIYPDYKANRKRNPRGRNPFVPIIRQLAVAEDLAVNAHGREADDLVRIWANEAKAAGRDFIICTSDKDLKCIPGKYYNITKKELSVISKEEACRHFYEQLLKGDPTDNIPGIPGIGPVKATNTLKDLNDEQAFQEAIVEQYLIAFGPDLWHEALLLNGKLLNIQNHVEDFWDISHWPIIQELVF
jgi:5'-3' exonuclease